MILGVPYFDKAPYGELGRFNQRKGNLQVDGESWGIMTKSRGELGQY